MLEKLKITTLLRDRKYLFALIGLAAVVLFVVVITAVYVRPGELRVPVRYSRFDSKNYSLGQWFYLLNFLLFSVVVFVGHLLVSAKLYQEKGRDFALGFVYAGTTLLIIAAVFFLAIFRVVSFSQ
jgi:cytochrome bd-type quinol oxidase subunit 2